MKSLLFPLLVLAGPLLAAPAHVIDKDRKIHGPITHENLGLFIITGKEAVPGADFATLEEAMSNKWVVVHETGNVGQLAVENVTDNRTVVVLAGAVVKGGKQDRALSQDLVLAPRSGKVPIASFCVEQSRWQQRGGEAVAQFGANSIQVSGKSLRKAVKGMQGQSRVWSEVAKEQQKLSRNLDVDVQKNDSPTSYQLALENKKVQASLAAYRDKLAPVLDDYPDAIGYAVTINGEFSTADLYGSRGLFRKMWRQHLDSAITEAVSLEDKAPEKIEVDLAWRDELFREQAWEEKLRNSANAANDFVGEQNPHFFRYGCVLKQADAAPVLRQSFERREEGESLQAPPAGQLGVQQELQQNLDGINFLNDLLQQQRNSVPRRQESDE